MLGDRVWEPLVTSSHVSVMEREDLETSLDKQASLHSVDPSRNLMPWGFLISTDAMEMENREQCSKSPSLGSRVQFCYFNQRNKLS